MKKFRAKMMYKRLDKVGDVWERGKDVTIKARNYRSAYNKAMDRSTCYTHYEIIEEVLEKEV